MTTVSSLNGRAKADTVVLGRGLLRASNEKLTSDEYGSDRNVELVIDHRNRLLQEPSTDAA